MPAKIATRRSAIHGNGVFAIAPIRKGERLIEYKGRHRTHKEVDRVYGRNSPLYDAPTDGVHYAFPSVEVNKAGDAVVVYWS